MKYIYNGPASGVTLRFGEVLQEILLFPEQEVEMPADHEYTQTLEMLGYLTPVEDPSIYDVPAEPAPEPEPAPELQTQPEPDNKGKAADGKGRKSPDEGDKQ